MTKSELQQEVIKLNNILKRRDETIKYLEDDCSQVHKERKMFEKWGDKLFKQNKKLRAALKAIV